MVNKVRVTIAGAPYAIATTDSEKLYRLSGQDGWMRISPSCWTPTETFR